MSGQRSRQRTRQFMLVLVVLATLVVGYILFLLNYYLSYVTANS